MINKINKWLTRDKMGLILVVSLMCMPIFDLDNYFLYPLIENTILPLPSTIYYLLWMPLLVLTSFIFFDKKKKRTAILFVSYFACIALYFVYHNQISIDLSQSLHLTNNFYYSMIQELLYIFKLIIPLLIIYMVYIIKPNHKQIKILVVGLTLLIAIPIVVSNLFTFGQSTYVGMTKMNFISWFSNGYEMHHPRELATKFFFTEGNTTGILLFMLVPMVSYYFKRSKSIERWLMLGLLIIQGLSMIILSTRVATYGFAICMFGSLVVALFLFVIKKERFDFFFTFTTLILGICFVLVLPYTPAVVNQTIDAETGDSVNDSSVINSGKDDLNNRLNQLVPGSVDYDYALQYMFLQYRNMLTTPDVYYEVYYHYTFDSQFWVDLIFEVPFEERINGRQFEQIFFDYKYKNLDDKQKLFGFGYSTFMNGSILLEQDFTMQIYTLGYIGFALLCAPWFLMLAYVIIRALINIKLSLNFNFLMLGMSICCGLIGAYMSGHVLDEYMTSYFMAFVMGMLIIPTNQGEINE